MPGTLGAELIEDLKPNKDVRLDPELLFNGEFQEIGSNELVYYRPRWGAFHNTGLEDALRAQQITTLVICGFRFSTGDRKSVVSGKGVSVSEDIGGSRTSNKTSQTYQPSRRERWR